MNLRSPGERGLEYPRRPLGPRPRGGGGGRSPRPSGPYGREAIVRPFPPPEGYRDRAVVPDDAPVADLPPSSSFPSSPEESYGGERCSPRGTASNTAAAAAVVTAPLLSPRSPLPLPLLPTATLLRRIPKMHRSLERLPSGPPILPVVVVVVVRAAMTPSPPVLRRDSHHADDDGGTTDATAAGGWGRRRLLRRAADAIIRQSRRRRRRRRSRSRPSAAVVGPGDRGGERSRSSRQPAQVG